LIQPGIRYDPQKDLAPISQVTDSAIVLIANRNFPPDTVQELIALAKQKPGAINFGSSGPGSIEDLSGELFKVLAHVDMTHIPYRGTSQSLADLLAGRLQIVFENLPAVLGHIQGGEVKAIAIGTAHRSSFLPNLPTIAEAGVPGYRSSSFLGLLAPAKTPQYIIDRLHQAVVAALHDPQTATRLRSLGLELVGNTPQQFAAYIADRIALTAKVVQAAHLKQG
jgi:tripartite-type tricarboxylate transporter receptor subunit TctC